MLDHFWGRWRKEYLSYLRENQKSTHRRRTETAKLHDVVIVYDEKEPRHLWRIGKIVLLITSEDGKIRGAEVKIGKTNSIIRRPVNKLYPLVTNTEEETVDNTPFNAHNRPKRNAAEIGQLRRKFEH